MLGYIKLHRELEHTSWYSNTDALRLFIHLLLKVNYNKDCKIDNKQTSAGQLVSNYKNLSKEVYFSYKRLKKAIDILVSAKSLFVEDFGKDKLFTIANWEMYQCQNDNDMIVKTTISEKADSLSKIQEKKKEKERYIINNNISKEKDKFTPPTMEEVADYVCSITHNANTCEDIATRFVNYYSSINWHIGNTPISNWEGLCHNWVMNEGKNRR